MMKRITFLIAVALGLGSCSSEPASSDSKASHEAANTEVGETANVQSIGSREAKSLLEEQRDIKILDVRTPKEFQVGHLKDAKLLDFHATGFSKDLQALDPKETYLVYCAVGGRSGRAAQMMEKMGFQKVYEASEGFSALKNAGIPVEKD
jgi:rhodanese-related sulfurtransferase